MIMNPIDIYKTIYRNNEKENTAQPAVGTDLAFGQGSRRLVSSMALVVYWTYARTAGQAAQPQTVGRKKRGILLVVSELG